MAAGKRHAGSVRAPDRLRFGLRFTAAPRTPFRTHSGPAPAQARLRADSGPTRHRLGAGRRSRVPDTAPLGLRKLPRRPRAPAGLLRTRRAGGRGRVRGPWGGCGICRVSRPVSFGQLSVRETPPPPGPYRRPRGIETAVSPGPLVQFSGPTHASPMEALPRGSAQSARTGAWPHTGSTCPGTPCIARRRGHESRHPGERLLTVGMRRTTVGRSSFRVKATREIPWPPGRGQGMLRVPRGAAVGCVRGAHVQGATRAER